jgi:hypothetical protein
MTAMSRGSGIVYVSNGRWKMDRQELESIDAKDGTWVWESAAGCYVE